MWMVWWLIENVTSRRGSILAWVILLWNLRLIEPTAALIFSASKFHFYFLSKIKSLLPPECLEMSPPHWTCLPFQTLHLKERITAAAICITTRMAMLSCLFASDGMEIYAHSLHRKSISVNITEPLTFREQQGPKQIQYVFACVCRGDLSTHSIHEWCEKQATPSSLTSIKYIMHHVFIHQMHQACQLRAGATTEGSKVTSLVAFLGMSQVLAISQGVYVVQILSIIIFSSDKCTSSKILWTKASKSAFSFFFLGEIQIFVKTQNLYLCKKYNRI